MHASLLSLLICAGAPAGSGPEPAQGFLWQPAFCLDTLRRAPAVRYDPQPGDLLILNSSDRLWKMSYRLALSGPPTHSAIVVRLPDGQFAMLEAGIGLQLTVELSPLHQRMPDYDGDVYVRRRKTPLTKDESDRLTEYARAVCKAKVPVLRFPLQVTPFRTRGPIRTAFLAKPRGMPHTFMCSELVIEAFVAAGLLGCETARPAATYPRDLFFDHSANPYLDSHLSPSLRADWHPPALWTVHP